MFDKAADDAGDVAAALRELEAFHGRPLKNGWRYMADAPTDATQVILRVRLGEDSHAVCVGYFGNVGWRDEIGSLDPTHWQPFPSTEL